MFGLNKRKPREFNYIPRFYDKDKEEREQLKVVKGVNDNIDPEKYVPGSLIKNSRLKRMRLTEEDQSEKKRAFAIRAIIFLALLLLAAYFLITFNGFEIMVESFTQGGN